MIIKEIFSLRKDRAELILRPLTELKEKYQRLIDDAFEGCSKQDMLSFGTYLLIKDSCLFEMDAIDREIKICEKAIKRLGLSEKDFKDRRNTLEEHIAYYCKIREELDREKIKAYQKKYGQHKTISKPKKQISAYEVLGIKPGASIDEVKRAYRIAAKKNHPDNGGNKNQFILTQRAYEFIMARIG